MSRAKDSLNSACTREVRSVLTLGLMGNAIIRLSPRHPTAIPQLSHIQVILDASHKLLPTRNADLVRIYGTPACPAPTRSDSFSSEIKSKKRWTHRGSSHERSPSASIPAPNNETLITLRLQLHTVLWVRTILHLSLLEGTFHHCTPCRDQFSCRHADKTKSWDGTGTRCHFIHELCPNCQRD